MRQHQQLLQAPVPLRRLQLQSASGLCQRLAQLLLLAAAAAQAPPLKPMVSLQGQGGE